MPKYQSTSDYIAARKAGDTETTSRIVNEVTARFNTRTTDGTEITELYQANQNTPLADPK
ncbi:hypothetical protein GA0115253_1004534 [Streptomyces sp. Termitarium-T10T-6]|nr:hypothetical protein [Streptomyces sp. Termitarium-T10T-6]SCD43278.1 hypothetical protein GA0115253_1004534 [Streptomyces sp. Termitarium-T10T-6]